MKIVHLIYNLAQGGAERFVVNLSNEQKRKGHEVYVIALLELEGKNGFFVKSLAASVQVMSLNFQRGFTLAKVCKVVRLIRSLKPDVVNCHLNVIPYIFPLCFFSKIKFFHTIHSVAEYAHGSNVQIGINRYFYSSGRIKPITISKECRESFEKFYALRHVIQIDNGAAQPELSKKFQGVRSELDGYRTTKETILFVHVARYEKLKNQSLLVDAFNELAAEGLDFALLVIGGNFDSDEGRKLQEHSVKNIHYLGLKANVTDYLSLSDAFCMTSFFEGLPISLLEALSCGCYPICTAVGGIPDVIQDESVGILSKDISVASYKDAILKYVNKRGKVDRKVLQEHFQNHFSMQKCASAYLKLYSEVMK